MDVIKERKHYDGIRSPAVTSYLVRLLAIKASGKSINYFSFNHKSLQQKIKAFKFASSEKIFICRHKLYRYCTAKLFQDYMLSIVNKLKGIICVSLLVFCNIFFVPAQKPITREYQVKAAFLYNFTQFISWSPKAFSSASSPFVIGIVGDDPFGSYLDETVAGEKVDGHPIVVQRYKAGEKIGDCQLLFFATGSAKENAEIMNMLKDNKILTVSDNREFMQQGGIIGLVTRNNKVKIQVNLEAAQSADLTISSKLLRLAEIFSPAKN